MSDCFARLSAAAAVCALVGCISSCRAQPPATAREPIAIVAGQKIFEADLMPRIEGELRRLRSQEYELKSRALEDFINERLVTAEAKQRGSTPEQLLQQEADSKISEPTDKDVEAFYAAQKSRINRPLEEVGPQIRQFLRQNRIQQARESYFLRLREKADVEVFLRPERAEVSYDEARARGPANAPVTIVEFSDFQCPFCERVLPTLSEILAKYKDKVKLAYRDFPLRQVHPRAQPAAEASRCAADQGKFWEYHNLLFANQSKLDDATLTEHARALKLDLKTFEECVQSGKHRAGVDQDMMEAMRLGVTGTPAFFINGILLSGAQPTSEFERVIEAELAPARKKAAGK